MTYYPGQPFPANDATLPLPPLRRGRPGADDRQTSLLFWLAMLVLGCVSLAGMTWGASNVLAQKGSEKLLRVDLLLPKLKSIQWAKVLPKDRNPLAPHVSPPTLGHSSVTVHETPHHTATPEPWNQVTLPPIVETCDEPVVYLTPCTLQRGDSPMMRNWKTLTMYSLLTAAAATLAPPPLLLAQDDNKDAIDKLSKEIKALTKNVQAMTNRIGELEAKPTAEIDKATLGRVVRAELKALEEGVTDLSTDVKAVKKRVDGIKDDLSSLQAEQLKHKLQIDNQKTQIEFLTEEVGKLNKKLIAGNSPQTAPTSPAVDRTFMEELRSYMKKLDDTLAKLGTEKRLSMSPAIGAAPPSYGRLVLNNLYSDDLLFIVNGISHRVAAQTKLVLENVPVGIIRYEIAADRWGPLENQSISLRPGETFTLRAVNRP